MATSTSFSYAIRGVRPALALLCAIAGLVIAPAPASAANVLFVSDNGSESVIASILGSDGHTVTTRTGDFSFGTNHSFHEDLSSFDCIIWVAAGDGFGSYPHTDIEAFTNLTDYVDNGGRVFVTGFGAVGSGDTNLIQFLGGTGGAGYTGYPGVIADLDTSLSNGTFDIRNVTPRGWDYQYEGLTGLGPDTIALVASTGGFGVPATQWSLRGLGSGEIAYVAAGQPYSPGSSSAGWASSAGATADGAYNAAVRNFVAASEGSASEPGAPLVRFDSPFTANEGASIEVSAEINDEEGDVVAFSWDLDGDGTFGEATGESTVTIPAGVTDGPSTLRIGIEATDGSHTTQRTRSIRISNVAPEVLSTPPSVVAIGQHIRYRLVVADPAGLGDPLTFELAAGPPSSLVTTDGYFDWTPTESEVTAAGTATTISIRIDDGDMGRAEHRWQMTVLNDHAPSDPTPQYPTQNLPVQERQPRLVVSDAVDIDADTITYFFEIDRSDSFDSDELQSSGPVAEEPVLTSWTPGTPLGYGTWFWRVWVSDGIATTQPVMARFVVVPDPTMIPDAGPSDGGVDASMPVDGTPRDCSCTVTSPRGDRTATPALGLIGLGLVVALRRRRR